VTETATKVPVPRPSATEGYMGECSHLSNARKLCILPATALLSIILDSG